MFIFTTRFSKKRAVLSVVFFGLVIAVLVILASRLTEAEEAAPPQLTDNAQRVEYLQSLGWTVETEPLETLQFLLPQTLGEPYLSYNELQTAQGFDLSEYCGKQVSRYTYAVTNYPGRPEGVQANLYVCEEIPVGGDIFCPGAEGFQEALVRPQAEGET